MKQLELILANLFFCVHPIVYNTLWTSAVAHKHSVVTKLRFLSVLANNCLMLLHSCKHTMLQGDFNEVRCAMLCPKAPHSAKAIVGAPGHCQNRLHYVLANLADTVAVKDTSRHLGIHPWLKIVSLTSDFHMLLKTKNRGLPAEVWSPTGQRLHHLIGLLPDPLQAFLLRMNFKTGRHLKCMPTLWVELI